VRARSGAFGVDHQDVGVFGHQVYEHLHLVDQRRRQRLHAFDGDAGRDLVGQLDQLWVLLTQLGRATADLVGEQQLATRRSPEPIDGLEGPLVGDGEAADLFHVVAPELHTQRVLLGWREDVDDSAPDRELTALLDQVDAGVRRVREPAYDVLERSRVARREGDRLEVAEPLDLRLEDRPDRRDHHPQRSVRRAGPGVPQPPEDREPAADGVAAGAQSLVRKRLPAGVVADLVRVHQVAERGHEVLALPCRRGHRQHRAPGVDQALDQEGPQRGGPGEVERGEGAGACVLDGSGQRGVGEDGLGQSGQAQRCLLGPISRGAQHDGPQPGSAGGPGQFTAPL
jgi:hypothetical protein